VTAPELEGAELGRSAGFQAALIAIFGVATTAAIQWFDEPALERSTLLLLALSASTLLVALVWFFVLAVGRGARWWVAMLIPYVNLIAVSMFARRYWNAGARLPALLLFVAMALQLLATLRLLSPSGPTLV